MIAFLIAAHADPRQAARLVDRLSPHDCYLHIDAKTPIDEAWRAVGGVVVEPRVAVYWAGYSQVEASLALIRAALAADVAYDRLVLLSGACYPIRPLNALERFFRENPGVSFTKHVRVDASAHLRTLTERRHRRDGLLPAALVGQFEPARLAERGLRKLYELALRLRPPPSWPGDFTRVHGSSWWAITPEAGRTILDFVARNPWAREAYREAFAADEQVFHSILANSDLADRSGPEIAFTGRGVYMTANLHHIHPSLTKTYTLADLDAVRASDKFFLRKVQSGVSDALLDVIDAERLVA